MTIKYRLIVLTALFSLLFNINTTAKPKLTKIYMVGIAASFNDSTLYVTDIQEVDSAWIDSKRGFLWGRDGYSLQLKEHLQSKGITRYTCFVSFAKTRAKAEKKFLKFRKKYTGKVKYDINHIDINSFKFTAIKPQEDQ